MCKVGDLVLHQKTGRSGTVVGYGHQMIDGTYLPTLQVRVVGSGLNPAGFIEDLTSMWTQLQPVL